MFIRQDDEKHACPRVEFDKYVNNLIVTLATYPQKIGSNASDPKEESITIENVPLQKMDKFCYDS